MLLCVRAESTAIYFFILGCRAMGVKRGPKRDPDRIALENQGF
jgi:hypothetical protein